MIISLMNKKSITSIVLPEKIRGQYIIENSEGIKVEIEGIDEKWYIKSNKKVKLLNNEKKHTNSCEITEMAIYNLDITGSSEKTFIFAEPSTNDRVEFKKYLVRNDITINIGRNSNNDIVIDNKYVSSVHAKLTLTNAGWKIKDADSSNGTFVNGKRINESRLKFGDVIYIMGVVIIIGKNLFAINNPDQTLKIDTTLLKPYLSQCYEQNDDEFDFETIDDDTFYRSPRFKRDVEKAVFKIDAPPASQVGEEMPMMLAIGPSMTMGMASMATAVYGVAQGNMMSAVTSGSIIVVINNYAAFLEMYEDYENDMLNLTREGTKYGIYFILTATATNALRFRMLQNIGQSYVLQMTDETDYAAVLGKTGGLVPEKIKGRGLFKSDEIYEFQIAHAFECENQFAAVRNYCEEMRKKYPSIRARKIPVLPEQVNLEFIQPFVNEQSLMIPVGVETESLEVSYLNMSKQYISCVYAEGKDYTAFISMLGYMSAAMANINTTVIDSENQLKHYDKANYLFSKKSISEGIDTLFATVLERHNTIKDAENEGKEIPQYPLEVVIISSLYALKEQLEEKENEKLALVLEKGSQKLNVRIIIAESAKCIASYNFEKWYKTNISQTDGIWIGNGITDQYYLKLTKTTSEMTQEISNQYGYSVKAGKAVKVKLIYEGEVE